MRLFVLSFFVIVLVACGNEYVREVSNFDYISEEASEMEPYDEPEEELLEEFLEEPYEYDYELEFVYDSPPASVIGVSAAHDHTLIIAEDNSLWTWGLLGVGDGTAENRRRPVQIMEDVIFAVAGQGHSFAITSDNMLWAWGSNFVGQLGDGTTEPRLYPVAILDNVVYAATNQDIPDSHVGMGSLRSYAIRTDASLWACA